MVRIGLIGAGTMGQWYAQTFAEYEGAELAAICDLRREAAETLAAEWNAPGVYEDYRVMLDRESLDAVAVATPDKLHRDPVIAGLEAGKHVLCEKPLATTMVDGLAIQEAVVRSGKKFMVNFGNRQRSRAQQLRKTVLEERAVGEIGNVYVELNERISKTDTLAWANETSPVWFLLSHCVDYVRYVTGLEIVEVFGYETRKVLPSRGLNSSDTCVFVGKLSNEGRIFLGSTWAYPDEYAPDIDFNLRVLGDQGLVECQMHPHDFVIHRGATKTINYTYPYTDHKGHRENWWAQSTRHFVHCVATEQQPTPDVDDGLRCLKVLLAMDESVRTGAPVRIEY